MTESLVSKALVLWNLDGAGAELAAQRENHVYRISGADGGRLALRFHRRGYRSDQELASELAWMGELGQQDLSVPRPIRSRHGNLHEIIDGHQTDLLTWLDGRPMGRAGERLQLQNSIDVFRNLGASMARLHRISDDWQLTDDFQRCAWNIEGLLGENPVWGRFWENPYLSSRQRQTLLQARDQAQTFLQSKGDQLDYGLIHADLVRENVLIAGDDIQLIDFDDGGFGFRLFDVATTLLANRGEPDFEVLQNALIAGYRTVRPLDVSALPLFLMLRAFTYVGWVVSRLDEAGAEARSRRFCERAVSMAEAYLADRKGNAA